MSPWPWRLLGLEGALLRRLVAILFPALVLAFGTAVGPAPAGAQIDREDLRRGLVYRGLQRVMRIDL